MGFLVCIPALVRQFGVDPLEVLAAAGLGARALDDPESTIPYRAMGLLVETAAEKTGCPHIGLEIGKHIRIASLGLIGELMRNAPTIGSALMDFATHHHRNSHGGVVYLMKDDRKAFFGYAICQTDVAGNKIIYDGAALAAYNFVSELAGPGHSHQLKVLLSRSEPADLTPYRQAFGLKLGFNAEQTAVLLPHRLLDNPVQGADVALRKILEKRVETLWPAGDLDIVTQLRRVLRVALLRGQTSADEISAQLGMSHRTLNRRLKHQRLGFQDMLDETRYEFAQQLLANTQLDVNKIATIVGYADPSILTRGFIRWIGVTPSEWRSSWMSIG